MKLFGHFLQTLTITTSLLGTGALAQTTLSQIADTVNNPDGSPFNGSLSITWTGAATASVSSATPYSTNVKIYNGVLSVKLAPSTTAVPAGFYLAVYTSSDGRTSWVETWQVGPSAAALTLSQVRTTTPPATSGGSTNTLGIGQVTGLSAYLNAISSSLNTMTTTVGGFSSTVGGLSNTVSNLQSTVTALSASVGSGAGSATFIDGEIPAGTIDGTNAQFTVASIPSPASSVLLSRNGILLVAGQDFSLSGSTITFLSNAKPLVGDTLLASYRLGTASSTNFVDAETPRGTVDGTNLTFTLGATPTGSSLRLFKNGFLLIGGTDYVLSGSTITFSNRTSTPSTGDTLLAYYRTGN